MFIVNSLARGGSEHKTVKLANGLMALGHRPVVAYLNAADALLPSLDAGVEAACLHRRGYFSLRALRHLLRLVDEHQIDVVVAVNLYPTLYAVAVHSLRRNRALRMVVSLNTFVFTSRTEIAQMYLYRRILDRFDVIAFGAAEQKRLWENDYHFAIAPERAAILYNGIDPGSFKRSELGAIRPTDWPDGRLIIGTVGGLRPEKAQIRLLDALVQVRRRGIDAGLVIVGEGPERGAIENHIRLGNLDEVVRLVGDVADVRPYLAAFDVFALSSVSETFSNATLEAMAMECPVVVPGVGGMPEMLRHGGGILFPAGDLTALADALSELLSKTEQRHQLGEEARRAVEANFGVERMTRDFIAMTLESDQMLAGC